MSKRLAQFVGFVLILFVFAALLPCQMVLCISSHGHVALEHATASGQCRSACEGDHAHGVAPFEAALGAAETTCCGECMDIPLPANTLVTTGSSERRVAAVHNLASMPASDTPQVLPVVAADSVARFTRREESPPLRATPFVLRI